MIDPDNMPEQPEQLTKVLPSGGPLLGGAWTCPVCGTTWPSGKPELCHDVPAAAGCPVERAT